MDHSVGIITSSNFLPIGGKVKLLKVKEHSKMFLCIWKETDFCINRMELKANCEVRLTDIGKDLLKFKYPVIGVFTYDEYIYAVDKIGGIYKLNYRGRNYVEDSSKDTNDMDMFVDMNETNFTENSPYEWSHSLIEKIELCDIVKSAYSINDKFVVVIQHSDKLFGKVFLMKPFKMLFVINLLVNSVDKVVLTCTDVIFSKELKEQYLPFQHTDDNELAFVGLCSGQTLCFSTSKLYERPEVILSSSDAVLDVEFYFDEVKKCCTAFLILFSSGQLVLLDGKQPHNIYIPGPLDFGLFNGNKLAVFSSSGINSFLSRISFDSAVKDSCMNLSLKDVQCACTVPDVPNMLIISSSNGIYWLDTLKMCSYQSLQSVIPEEMAIHDLLSTAKQLNNLHGDLEDIESLITAISLASRAQFLEKYYVILVKFYSGRRTCDDRLKLRIENDCDFASFNPKLWCLNITISFGNKCMKSYVHRLTKTFTKDSPITCEVNCSPFIESELSCKLIARINFQGVQRTLIVSLGKITLDAGYFFNVVKNKVKFLQEVNEITSRRINKNNDCTSNNSPSETPSNSPASIYAYCLRITPSIILEKIFHVVLRNSSHRMTKKQWLEFTEGETTEITLSIGETIWVDINLNKENRVLTFKSNDALACFSVKTSVSSKLNCHEPVELDVERYISAEGIKWRFQLEILSSEDICLGKNIKKLEDMKQQFRQVFS